MLGYPERNTTPPFVEIEGLGLKLNALIEPVRFAARWGRRGHKFHNEW